jgi:mannose/cellobiose epimerase-like protein (N-acyl-D-glucosamine 2-epimerase family)
MPFTIANPHGTGSDQDLLDITRGMIAQITVYGHSYDHEGKRVDRASLKDLWAQVERLEARIAADSRTAGSAVNYASRRRAL